MPGGAQAQLPIPAVHRLTGTPAAPKATFVPAEPELVIHTLDELLSDVRRRRGPVGAAASIVAHAGLVVAVIVVPLLLETPLPETGGAARAFFATPLEMIAPPPPPPPAPATRGPSKSPAPEAAPSTAFVTPLATPNEIVPEAGIDPGLDLGIEGGVPGGVEGGVPGGVVGGIIGGLPEALPPPAPPPIRVGGGLSEPRKIKSVAPVYPEPARMARLEGLVILECHIDPRGQVTGVEVLRSDSVFDDAAVDAVRQWVYAPTLLDGVPVAVLLTVTIHFRLLEGP